MRFLLDTHIFLWCINDDTKLSKKARLLIQEAEVIYVSSVSVWEMSIKINLGKLTADPNELVAAITKSGFLELPLTALHVAKTHELADIHRDPFDRVLIAQALTEPLKLLTADKILGKYSDVVQVI